MNKTDIETTDAIVGMYRRGDKISLIAAETGVSTVSIWRIIKREGVERRKTMTYKNREALIGCLRASGLHTVKEIMAITGASASTILHTKAKISL